MTKFKLNWGLVIVLGLATSITWADSLELKNGSLIKGKFMGGAENEISFQVGSSVQKYNLADIVSLKFDSERTASEMPTRPKSLVSGEPGTEENAGMKTPQYVTIPAGTRISSRLPASPRAHSKETATFTGKSLLRLELTGIVVNGQTVPVVTGEYELTGKSRGASTAKRTAGGAAVGSIIGAIAGGGKGAAIGAGVGGGVGAGSEIITKGDQVKVPSETLLDFTLQQDVSIPRRN